MRDLKRFAVSGDGGWDHAVVVGAGMSGLLAGRILAEYFGRVTLVERDLLSASGQKQAGRKGVPQGRHLHSLAARGGETLERYFPGLDAELAAAGCPALDQAWDALNDLPAGRLPRFRSGITMRAASRSLLEERVRNRLEKEPNVSFLAGREAVGLVPGAGDSVAGVRMKRRDVLRDCDGSSGTEETLIAGLVVDTSGQGSRAPRWLEELGYRAPEEEVVDARLGYATRWFRAPSGSPEGSLEDWTGIAVLPGWPENTRGGALRRVEGGLWTAVLIGLGGDYPPTEGEAFLEFARTLPSSAIYEAIKTAEPVSPVYGYRRTANRRRCYDRARLPKNFLAAGDAACVLNPSYGSGITAAALSAETLDECLNELQCQRRRGPDKPGNGLAGLGRWFHERQAAAIEPCWALTTNSDRQWSAASPKDLGLSRRLLHRISDEVMALAVERESVALTLLEVKNLLKPPSALLRPSILLPALGRTALYLLTKYKKPRSLKPEANGNVPSDFAISGERTAGWLIGFLFLSPSSSGDRLSLLARRHQYIRNPLALARSRHWSFG